MYTRHDSYELTPSEVETFGRTEVKALFDSNMNGVVINHPDNGVLAGDRLPATINPDFKKDQAETLTNRRYTYRLTDDYNAELAIILAEKSRGQEHAGLNEHLGELAIISNVLPYLGDADASTLKLYAWSVAYIAEAEDRARNPEKKQARTQLEEILTIFKERGLAGASEIEAKVLRSEELFDSRQQQLYTQTATNKERLKQLQQELRFDRIRKNILRDLGANTDSISANEEAFLHEASGRLTKPGALTVNNAWYHRHSATSWQEYIKAQEAWEALYGSLMHTMSALRAETVKHYKRQPEKLLGKYAVKLFALENIIDMSMIGGDYTKLAVKLQQELFRVEELLLTGQPLAAIKAARLYRFLLRYRTLDPTHPPEEWYGGLPVIRIAPGHTELTEAEIWRP